MEATDKQVSLINSIESILNIRFEGKTKREATEFISRHLAEYSATQSELLSEAYNPNHY